MVVSVGWLLSAVPHSIGEGTDTFREYIICGELFSVLRT